MWLFAEIAGFILETLVYTFIEVKLDENGKKVRKRRKRRNRRNGKTSNQLK